MNILKSLCIFSALTAFAVSTPAMAEHDGDRPEFTARSIAGAWGFSAAGVILLPDAPGPLHVVAVGIMEFDGAGGCVITDTINLGGQAVHDRLSLGCAYRVNPDGSGTIDAAFAGEPGPVPLSFTIVDRANSLRFIRTDIGVASGVAQRQNPGRH